jgi:TDG/mug DNA glycosylase family protein
MKQNPHSSITPWKPTQEQIAAAAGKSLPDVIAPRLKVLFCGINPGLYTAAVGHHFARPGNRFWPALLAAGFTDRLLSPFEEHLLLERGYGVTNVVQRATATAAELHHGDFVIGGRQLRRKVLRYRPRYLAILGIGAYRAAFDRPKATLGLQADCIGETHIWILPNPSGLNAHYQAKGLAELFRQLHDAADRPVDAAESPANKR